MLLTPGPRRTIAAEADALAGAGRVREALILLTTRGATDPDALFLLAHWRLGGRWVRRDLAAARDLFRRAADAGHRQAKRTYTAFVAGGVGGAASWPEAVSLLRRAALQDAEAAAQLRLLDRMRLATDGAPSVLPDARQLSDRPSARAFPGLLTAEECDHLIAEATPLLQPALVVDPRSGRQVPHPVRSSDVAAFPYVLETPFIHALNRRIAAASDTAVQQGEPLQVLRYRGRQQYRPHSDAIAGEPNQRILTMLVYLNDGYGGGETAFVRTGLRFKGGKGDALLFANTLPDGRADELAQHAGLPVTSGEKLIASRWIRARAFAPPPPTPLLNA